MTLSPTALEAAAKAISVSTGDEPDKLTYAREMQCSGADREPQYRWQYWTEHATAAITAYLAQREKEGWVMVPRDRMAEHAAWLRVYVEESNTDNWRDMKLRATRQLDDVDAMLAAAQNGGE